MFVNETTTPSLWRHFFCSLGGGEYHLLHKELLDMAQANGGDFRDFFFDVASSCPGVFSHISLHTLQPCLVMMSGRPEPFFLAGINRDFALARRRRIEERWRPSRSAISAAETPSSLQAKILDLSSKNSFLTLSVSFLSAICQK
jgi:hypothetical protein